MRRKGIGGDPMRTLSIALFFLSVATVSGQTSSVLDTNRYGLVYQIPEMKKVSVRADVVYKGDFKADFYYPPNHRPGTKLPVVVFCNGVGGGGPDGLKNWTIYREWGRLVAAKGFLGVTYESEQSKTRESLGDMIRYLQGGKATDADGMRIGIWACSANVGAGLPYLMSDAPKGVKCGVIYYGIAQCEKLRQDLPILYVKAEFDRSFGIDDLWRRAIQEKAPWNLVLGKGLPHAFDAFENTDASRAMVAQTLEFLESNLQPLPEGPPDTEGRRVLSYFYGNRPDKAVPILEKMVEREPSDFELKSRLLDGYEFANMLDKGLALGLKLAEDNPKEARTQSNLSKIYFKQKRYAESAAASSKAIELGMDQPGLRNGLGLAYLYLNENEKALKALEPFEAQNIPFAIGHYNLACAYARLGQREKAVSALGKAVQFGYLSWKGIEQDEDFKPIRDEAGYKALIDRLKSTNPSG